MTKLKIEINSSSKIFKVIEDKDTKKIRLSDPTEYLNIISRETGLPHKRISDGFREYVNNWHKVEGNWYIFHKLTDFYSINEILGQYISEYFDISTAKYYLAKYGSRKGVITPNFASPNNTYISLSDLGYHKIKYGFEFLNELENKYGKSLSDKLKTVVIRDFYTSEKDRYNRNLMFEKHDNTYLLSPLYDYELSFDTYKNNIYHGILATFDIRSIDIQEVLKKDDTFRYALNKLMNINMDMLLKKMEEEFNVTISNDTKEYYKKHDNKIKNYIREYKIV